MKISTYYSSVVVLFNCYFTPSDHVGVCVPVDDHSPYNPAQHPQYEHQKLSASTSLDSGAS